MSDLSDMYILIINIYRCKQTAEYFFLNCKQLKTQILLLFSCLFTFFIVNIGALLPNPLYTLLLLYFLGNFFYVKWTQPKTKTLPDIMMMNKILLKLRIMVSFLYLNWKKKTIFCKIITTIFFLVSKMKQKKATKLLVLKKVPNYYYYYNNKYITAHPRQIYKILKNCQTNFKNKQKL